MKYWIGTVCQEHVLRGVAGGFCQVCHGKAAPLNRMKRGDWLLYYSPKIRLHGNEKLQAFTAFGQILDDQAYPFQMSADFIPFSPQCRLCRDCARLPAQHRPPTPPMAAIRRHAALRAF